MQALKLRTAVFVGVSMGGAIALAIAAKYPRKVRGLGLLGSGSKMRVASLILETVGSPNTFESAVELINESCFSSDAPQNLKDLSKRQMLDVRPPVPQTTDERNPANQAQYRDEDKSELPLGERLKDTIARTVPYFENEIAPKMREGKRVIIAAHGNSLRALVMHFEKLTPDEIMKVNLPTGVPLVDEFDDNFNVISKQYLGDPEVIAAKINKVAAQGKKH